MSEAKSGMSIGANGFAPLNGWEERSDATTIGVGTGEVRRNVGQCLCPVCGGNGWVEDFETMTISGMCSECVW